MELINTLEFFCVGLEHGELIFRAFENLGLVNDVSTTSEKLAFPGDGDVSLPFPQGAESGAFLLKLVYVKDYIGANILLVPG